MLVRSKFSIALLLAAFVLQGAAFGAERSTVAAVSGNIVLTAGGRTVQLTASGEEAGTLEEACETQLRLRGG